MQYHDNSQLNNSSKDNMATIIKSIGEFRGEKGENIIDWIAGIEAIGKLMHITDEQIVRATILNLRGEAKTWSITLIKTINNLSWEELKDGLLNRFSNHIEADETLTRFLNTFEVKAYEELIQLLKDAKLINATKGINATHLMRQVIARSPAGIKSILIQTAQSGATWEDFLKQGEDAAWMAFPEKITGRITDETMYQNDTRCNAIKRNAGPAAKRFCHLHGEGNHSTKFCKVIQQLEKKGWKRESSTNSMRAVEEEENEDIKDINNYSLCVNELKAHYNPFFVDAFFNGKTIPVLIDTGADISLINERFLDGDTEIIKEYQGRLRSACGAPMEVKGKLGESDITIGDSNCKWSPLVIKNQPRDYAIMGVDSILKNKDIISRKILDKLYANRQTNKGKPTINLIKPDNILENYQEIFTDALNSDNKCTITKHAIPTTIDRTITRRNIQIPKQWEKELDKEVKKLLENKIIRESHSGYSSPIVPVRKKSGEVRMCIDFRALNEITIKDNYPLPRIDELLDELGKAIIFTILDATNGYYQIEINEEDKMKTAFTWKNGLYEFNRMPFGLCNAPATFQRTMDTIFRDINGKFVIPYLDDIIIFSNSTKEHEEHLEEVLKRLKNAGIVLNRNKCKIGKTEIKVLGVIISEGQVKPDLEKVAALNNHKQPHTIRELRAFLGLVNYCRGFIKDVAQLTEPLNNLLKGESKRSVKQIIWDQAALEAFRLTKQAMNLNTMRYQPNFDKEFILTTDASDVAIGAILSQLDDKGNEKIVHYYSMILDETQKRYSTTDKELLAIIKSMEKFRRYLIGKKFKLKTDHKALIYIQEAKNPSSRLLRRSLRLQEFDFQIEYLKGDDNGADTLSRNVDTKQIIHHCNHITLSDTNKTEILKEYHLAGAHSSASNMAFMIKDKYSWPNLFKDIDHYVAQCEICLKSGNKLSNTKNRIIKANEVNEMWEIDLIGRIPGRNGSNKFIFVAKDVYCKWIEAKVVNEKSAESIKQCIQDLIIRKHGIPKKILTDNGLEFKNKECQELAHRYKIEWAFNSPDHHETVGGVERANQSLWRNIQKLSRYGIDNWETTIQRALWAMNISHCRPIGTSPYILKFMKHPSLEIDAKLSCSMPIINESKVKNNLMSLRKQYDREIVRGKRYIPRDISIGEHVLIYRKDISNKMKEKWHTGYIVTKHIGEDAYEVKNNNRQYRLNKEYVKRDTTRIGGRSVVI
ncbi:hypothetical protein ENBRE01_1475 [Enteropsectra breve]|nr:hypothetical protein ENBRE01_1475 [Enteropsectra breve]